MEPMTQDPMDRSGPVYQHAFLQAIMQRGYVTETDAKHLFRRIAATESDDGYIDMIAEINIKIEPIKFELRRITWPGNGVAYIGFVNTETDEASRRATRFKTKDGKPEVRYTAFYRALVDALAAHPGSDDVPMGWVTETEALNMTISMPSAAAPPKDPSTPPAASPAEASRPASLGLTERIDALGGFVKDGWLSHTPGRTGAYSLGPRAFMELGPMLVADMELHPGPKAAIERAVGL